MECHNEHFIYPEERKKKITDDHREMVTHNAWILSGSSSELFVFTSQLVTYRRFVVRPSRLIRTCKVPFGIAG